MITANIEVVKYLMGSYNHHHLLSHYERRKMARENKELGSAKTTYEHWYAAYKTGMDILTGHYIELNDKYTSLKEEHACLLQQYSPISRHSI